MPTLQILDSLAGLPADDWDGLHGTAQPFLRHAFLLGLERTGCLRPQWGWRPRHAVLRDDDGRLLAAAPGYRKTNSHGEFVHDWAWADAWEQHGLPYYPKHVVAVPYSPVTGARLPARNAAARRALIDALQAQARLDGLSGVHVNFLTDGEDAAFDDGWLSRRTVQYHWHADPAWRDTQDFLDALLPKKRKTIRQERERLRRQGIGFRVLHGGEASAADLDAMHGLYRATFADKGNLPSLTPAFFHHLAAQLPRALVLVLAERAGQTAPIGGALCLRDGERLYGRYWGSHETVPGLHFETCYYQGIDYCLREGLAVFEPGAGGEHKLARGFLPVMTRSRHWIADARFHAALQAWCAEERRHLQAWCDSLRSHSPYAVPPPHPDDGSGAP